MIEKIKQWLGVKDTTPDKEVVKESVYQIEYYPITNRYYPTYNGKYFYGNGQSRTGIIEFTDNTVYAMFGETEEEALKLIERANEQRAKDNVIKIDVEL